MLKRVDIQILVLRNFLCMLYTREIIKWNICISIKPWNRCDRKDERETKKRKRNEKKQGGYEYTSTRGCTVETSDFFTILLHRPPSLPTTIGKASVTV